VRSTHTRYPNAVGKKVGVRCDGMVILEFKRKKKRAYLPQNLELLRPPVVGLGERGCERTLFYEVVGSCVPYTSQVGREVPGSKNGKIMLLFDDQHRVAVPLEKLRLSERFLASSMGGLSEAVQRKIRSLNLQAARTYVKSGRLVTPAGACHRCRGSF